MRRLMISAFLIFMAMLVSPISAAAGWDWCDEDPIVQIDGVRVQLVIAIPVQYRSVVEQTRVAFDTAKGADRQILFVDPGFSKHGERVKFKNLSDDSGAPMTVVTVAVPMKTDDIVPVRVTATVNNGAPMVFYGTQDGTQFTLHLVP